MYINVQRKPSKSKRILGQRLDINVLGIRVNNTGRKMSKYVPMQDGCDVKTMMVGD